MSAALTLMVFAAGSGQAEDYPPDVLGGYYGTIDTQGPGTGGGLIFSNNHDYGEIEIFVELFNNFNGDFNKYHWVYTVTNHTYDPVPGTSNGFSGFELALVQFVPDLDDQAGPPNWIFNCCSGLPVEWDITNTDGLGVMPGGVGEFSFTTLPRLVTISEGWYHTWQFDGQTDIVNYPPGEGPESPDLEDPDPPEIVLCCYEDSAGVLRCEPVIEGECEQLGGVEVDDCADCFPTPTEKTSWGKIKSLHQ
jgi:hypothetical protein